MQTDSKHDLENDEARGDVFIFNPTYDPFVADKAEITRKTEIVVAKAIQRARVLARERDAKDMELGHIFATLEDMREIDGSSVECFAQTILGLKPSVATYCLGKYRKIEQSGVGKKQLSKVCAANLSTLADAISDGYFHEYLDQAALMPPDIFLAYIQQYSQRLRDARRVHASVNAFAAAADERTGTKSRRKVYFIHVRASEMQASDIS